jgi:hypothetical protein
VAPTVAVASQPWVFTQRHPLSTANFISEAGRRGVKLDSSMLRQLYRRGLVIPFVYINDRQVGPKPPPAGAEPFHGSSLQYRLRYGRDRGRLSDLAEQPYRPRLRFEQLREADPRRWWNGLIYSWYQLLVLPEIGGFLDRRRYWQRGGHRVAWLPEPHQLLLNRARKLRTMAVALTALEARYLPKLDPEWIHLTNADPDEWQRYRDSFDPVAICTRLGYSATQARKDAEDLISRAHWLDPVGGSWSDLIRRAPRTAWKDLKDAVLSAMDYREAAEILLLFYEDLAGRGAAEPLLAISGLGWHPLRDRLSCRRRTLDEELAHLGISPHPRVVLAVEGETEQVHVPLVWQALDYPDAPELMRLLKLGGVDRNLEKVAALAVAPLVSDKVTDAGGKNYWNLIKPPTCLYVAVDPEGRYFHPDKVARTRTAILNEIKAVLEAQGVTTANAGELDELIKIWTWSQQCYEYAHFTDEELADAIRAVHKTSNGLSREELVAAIGKERARGKDIKAVWSLWEHKPGKPELAEALWPVLQAKIDRCRVDDTARVPEIVEVIVDAYHLAQRWRFRSFVLSEEAFHHDT